MGSIWSLALACLTKLKILTKHERILISYKFFHINGHGADPPKKWPTITKEKN